MKKIIYILLFCLGVFFGKAQGPVNLVPNPSFEDTLGVGCPFSFDELNKIKNWEKLQDSPDLYSRCATSTDVKVPKNLPGYQNPASNNCNNYCGFHAGGPGSLSSLREILGCQLATTLTINTKYFFSMKVNLADTSRSGVDKVGMKLVVNKPAYNTAYFYVDNFSQVFSQTIITDTLNWITIKGSFKADSLYKYLLLGNFYDFSNTNSTLVYPSSLYQGAYYYVDDVCLSTDSAFTYGYSHSCITAGISEESKAGTKNYFFPNPANSSVYFNNPFSGNYILKVKNISGDVVLEEKSQNLKDFINVDKINNGFYILQVFFPDERRELIQKLIINH